MAVEKHCHETRPLDILPASAKTVLIVEDQNEIAVIESYLLKSAGYKSRRATNGSEALERLRVGLRPDLILLDLVMPVMGGDQFLQEMRKDERFVDIPVVMLSAVDNPADVLRAVKHGAVDYCTKPLDPLALMQTIQRRLGDNEG